MGSRPSHNVPRRARGGRKHSEQEPGGTVWSVDDLLSFPTPPYPSPLCALLARTAGRLLPSPTVSVRSEAKNC
ncbi:hypothetical protein GUJ93_ZPchr0008g12213 [Zizania palustris]|uniref:Uncharacterized protein n=1 Tax=Zizania palustris TaxID=103762 RepID=A0A8J5RJ32_ZIZPA|nr:hypothetical protein GUJ93_ZPchr0008g12213 [Zizania palustris]